MRSAIIAAAFAALAAGNPLPQDLSWADIDAALESPIPTPSIPIINVSQQATTVSFNAVSATASVASAVSASGVNAVGTDNPNDKRALVARSTSTSVCVSQPAGSGPTVSPDSPSAFTANAVMASAASAAPTPSGYTQAFTNLQAANNAYGYMGYTVLSSYDTISCANQCNAIAGCASFNIYYERDPAQAPDTNFCPNPPSTNNIKCVFWGGPVSASNAVNNGQWRDSFQVVIAGSNGYVNNTIETPAGYSFANYGGSKAVNAPLDCNGDNTYMGVEIWTNGPFDVAKCAAACSAASVYDTEVGIPSLANPQTCQYFNTYILLRNGTNVGQYCALYNQTWSQSYFTNNGQYRGYDHYTIEYSYAFSNTTNPGTCVKN